MEKRRYTLQCVEDLSEVQRLDLAGRRCPSPALQIFQSAFPVKAPHGEWGTVSCMRSLFDI
jgi:hypothetical protein